MFRHLKRLQIGRPLSASALSASARLQEDLSRRRLNPYQRMIPFYARLSGNASAYDFVEVHGEPPASSSSGITWTTVVGGLMGTAAASEVNDTGGLDGKIALLEPTETGGQFRFVYPRKSGIPTCDLTSITGRINACNNNDTNGFTIVITDHLGATIASQTTNSIPAGQFIFLIHCVPGETYTFTVSKTGYTTVTQVVPIVCCQPNTVNFDVVQNPAPFITVNFHAASCESGEVDPACAPCQNTQSQPGIENVVVGLTVGGRLLSCVTDGNGDCTLTFPATQNNAIYPVSAAGGACVRPYVHNPFDDVLDSCTTQTLSRCVVMPADPRCHCFCCQNPRPDPLFLTDSVYGQVTMNWTGSEYSGAKLGAFAGGCGCPAALTSIDYTFRCGCNSGPPCLPGDCETTYGLTICYSAYNLFMGCDCPGPVSPILHPVAACDPGHGNPACAPNIILLDGVAFQNVTAKCAVPLNVVFTRGNPCPGMLTCGAGVSCPSPWVGPASWTVTE